MSEDLPFHDLIARVRAGDQDAAADLVRLYLPELRRYVRLRLSSPGLRRIFDSVDICQSVLANFFVRLSGGQFKLLAPDALARLLVTMARHKIVDYKRSASHRRDRDWDSAMWGQILGTGKSPSDILTREEMLRQGRSRLSADELALIDLRMHGQGWHTIAETYGVSPDALRKRVQSAVRRVRLELGLEKDCHD